MCAARRSTPPKPWRSLDFAPRIAAGIVASASGSSAGAPTSSRAGRFLQSGNKKEAQAWLERAAQHGNAEAQYELGNAFREGMGVVQDYEHAMKWLQLAAASGNGDAQYALGQMHRAGMGVPADNVKAYMWFNLATAQDVAGASAQRDAVLRVLSPDEVLAAQAEARRLSQSPDKPSAAAR